MDNKTEDSHMRIKHHTRQRLKIMAAKKNMTMQDLVEWLLSEQEKREAHATKNV
ncbi:MAG: hypothetical protein PVSMB2_37840 [Ktedonobacteraceae bacterium]